MRGGAAFTQHRNVDSNGLMLAMQGDLENASGMVLFHAKVQSSKVMTDGDELSMADGMQLHAQLVVNAAGLQAPGLGAGFEGFPQERVPKAFYAKGNYFTLTGKAPFTHLIYPVPEEAELGVHLTLDMGGQAKFGPDVQWVESGFDLQVDPARSLKFYDEVRKCWPALRDDSLAPGYAGICPKISGQGQGQAGADFVIDMPADHGVADVVQLLGIESPGLTSSLDIAEYVANGLAA